MHGYSGEVLKELYILTKRVFHRRERLKKIEREGLSSLIEKERELIKAGEAELGDFVAQHSIDESIVKNFFLHHKLVTAKMGTMH